MIIKKFNNFLAEEYTNDAPLGADHPAPSVSAAVTPDKIAKLGEAIRGELIRRNFTLSRQDIGDESLLFKAIKFNCRLELTFRGGQGEVIVGRTDVSTLQDASIKFFGAKRVEPSVYAGLRLISSLIEIDRMHGELKSDPSISYGDRHGFNIEDLDA